MFTPYEKAFWLTGNRGNNAFSYEKRGSGPKLFVPFVLHGGIKDIALGDEVVFEELDESGQIKKCSGLKFFIKTKYREKPIVVMDNHNHSFYFWYEAWASGLLRDGTLLIHVDQHKDYRPAPASLTTRDLNEVFRYTNEVLNVGNYIRPAEEDGLIGKINFITNEEALRQADFLTETVSGNSILNIDMDFFAPEMRVNFDEAKKTILKLAAKAGLITVATSPFFIDQKLAKKLIQELFD